MPKFTPGPWETDSIYECSGDATISILANDGEIWIADVFVIHEGAPDDPEEGIRNAKLMAAAPDLYEACKAALQDYRNINYPTDTHKAIMKQLQQALAKAEGRDGE